MHNHIHPDHNPQQECEVWRVGNQLLEHFNHASIHEEGLEDLRSMERASLGLGATCKNVSSLEVFPRLPAKSKILIGSTVRLRFSSSRRKVIRMDLSFLRTYRADTSLYFGKHVYMGKYISAARNSTGLGYVVSPLYRNFPHAYIRFAGMLASSLSDR